MVCIKTVTVLPLRVLSAIKFLKANCLSFQGVALNSLVIVSYVPYKVGIFWTRLSKADEVSESVRLLDLWCLTLSNQSSTLSAYFTGEST